MPVQGPPWTEFLSCHVCFSMFDELHHRPISLGCGHTVCKTCLAKMQNGKCPFDQSPIMHNINDLPANYALLQLVGATIPEMVKAEGTIINSEHLVYYESSKKCIEDLAVFLKSADTSDMKSDTSNDEDDGRSSHTGNPSGNSALSRPMQRRLVALVNCQLIEVEGRSRAMRAARSLGERTVTELILQHQNPHQLSANLWAAVRARGCQFLGPAMQEEVLKLILLVLEDASALSRKVLVLFVVQQLEDSYPQASKTAIGHVVQLLYRASCFKVTKREEESSLMQLKEEFRSYEALRREHDSQIVQIAMEAGLRISPEQWSSLLYGDTGHKSHMQSIIDKLQTPQSFMLSINELAVALQRTSDPCNLQRLRPHFEFLANVDPSPDVPPPTWENLEAVMKALCTVVEGLVDFFSSNNQKKGELLPLQNARYKTSMCRDQSQQGTCPRGGSCTFAHSQEELEKYRARSKKLGTRGTMSTFAALNAKEKAELEMVHQLTSQKLAAGHKLGLLSCMKLEEPIEKLAAPSETCLTQSPSGMSLPPKPLSPKVTRPLENREKNSGLPQGNMTPSVSTPAHYRKSGLGTGSGVKETYYHQQMVQGTARMTPCEVPPSEGPMHIPRIYNTPPRSAPMPPTGSCGQYPMMYLPQQDPSLASSYQNPYMMYEHPAVQNQGSSCYCGPDHSHGGSHVSTPAFPTFLAQNHTYIVAPPSQSPYQAPPSGSSYMNQGLQTLSNLHKRRNTILSQLHQKSTLTPQGSEPWSRPENEMTTQSKMPYLDNQTSSLAKSIADTYAATRGMFSLANSGLLSESPSSPTPCQYIPWSVDDSSNIKQDAGDESDRKSNTYNEGLQTPSNQRNTPFSQLHQKSMLVPQGSEPWNRPENEMTSPSKLPSLNNQTSSLPKSTNTATRGLFSLANSGLPNESQSSSTPYQYIPWSVDDSSNIKQDAGDESDCKSNTYNETGKEGDMEKPGNSNANTKNIFTLFQEDVPNSGSRNEDSQTVQSQQYTTGGSYDDHNTFIPFGPSLVSRYGPIARMARSRLRNSDPVQVTANNKTIKRMAPANALPPVDCTLPMSSPISSRFSTGYTLQDQQPVHGSCHRTLRSNVLSMWPSGHDTFMMSSDPTGLVRHQLQRKVAHLEDRAHGAHTEDESLAYELQAIDLRISLQSDQASADEVRNAGNIARNLPVKPPPRPPPSTDTSWASDTALTRPEQKKLKELARTFATNDNVTPQEEQVLSQLLKLRGLGGQDFNKSW